MYRTIPAIVLALVASSAALAGVPDVVTYAGTLKQGAAPADGTFTAVFELFDAASDGNRVFAQTEASLAVTGGDLVVDLGSDASNPLTDDLLASGQLFLQITVNGESLSPRVPFTSVPFARRAKVAEEASTLAGLLPDDIANLVQAGPGLASAAHVFSIADQGVTNAKIADGAVGATKLADGSVSSTKIQANAVGTNSILDGAISTAKLGVAAVTGTKIAAQTILNGNLANGSVDGRVLALESVTVNHLQDGAVVGQKMANGVINRSKLAQNGVAVYRDPEVCGGDLRLDEQSADTHCFTQICGTVGGLKFYECTGSCGATAPQSCAVTLTPVGFLVTQ
jgi:hypothetical protein